MMPKQKRNYWKLDKRNCVQQQASDEIATPRFDRLAGQNGLVKIIMKDGMKYERSTSDYSGHA